MSNVHPLWVSEANAVMQGLASPFNLFESKGLRTNEYLPRHRLFTEETSWSQLGERRRNLSVSSPPTLSASLLEAGHDPLFHPSYPFVQQHYLD